MPHPRRRPVLVVCAVLLGVSPSLARQASLGDVLSKAEIYVGQYEDRFSILVAEE